MKQRYKLKFKFNESSAIDFFISNGYVVLKSIYSDKFINQCYQTLASNYRILEKLFKSKKLLKDHQIIQNLIADKFFDSEHYEKMLQNKKMFDFLLKFCGPDICALNFPPIFFNLKGQKNTARTPDDHIDIWTGTSIDTLFCTCYFTDTNSKNNMVVYPGSHVHGMLPVRNRKIDPLFNIKLGKPVNIDHIKKGDVLIFHSLLVHATVPNTSKNDRVSMNLRYKSTSGTFTTQEQAVGYRSINVGPLNHIKRIVGNDYLTPLRTYGGVAGIDKRFSKIYGINKKR